ncbi:MAG: Gfo/Idh/MocA family oxidoreductase, partial [Spirochaetota bacterium]
MGPLCLGIMGTGNMAAAHAEAFRAIGDEECKLWAACDVREQVLAEYARRFGLGQTYTRPEDLLADPRIDAVCIVTPDRSHEKLSIAA